MRGFQFYIKGNWAHFKKPETNNNPLTHDLIPKTALIGMIGAVNGIERAEMKELYPKLSSDIIYGVQLISHLKKMSWGFTSRKAINPIGSGNPKYFEFLKDVEYKIIIGLTNERSSDIFENFINSIKNGNAIYTPVLGWHNCPANLKQISEGEISDLSNGTFKTKGFVSAKKHTPELEGLFRVGFDRVPTFQDDQMWNDPDKYINVIYPDSGNDLKVKGDYYNFTTQNSNEQWYLI